MEITGEYWRSERCGLLLAKPCCSTLGWQGTCYGAFTLEQRMLPKDLSPKSTKRMPDFDYIRKELLKNGVNKKLLWTEYLEECSQNGDDALMYSQFCYYI